MRKYLVFWYDGNEKRVSIVYSDKELDESRALLLVSPENGDVMCNGIAELETQHNDALKVWVDDVLVDDPMNVYDQ